MSDTSDGGFFERLRDAIELLDIEGWLSQYVDTKVGGRDEIRLEICPKCGNDEYKIYVNTDHKHWICYVCDWGRGIGDTVILLSAVSGRTMWDVRKELLETAAPAPAGDLAARLADRFTAPPKPPAPLPDPVAVPGVDGFSGMVGSQVVEYAYERGLTPADVILYRLRPATRLRAYRGPFLVFPVEYGTTAVGWQGRRIYDGEPKYVSSDDVAQWLWPMLPECLDIVRRTQEVNLVEGVFDAAGFWRVGEPAFDTFGKKISERQIALLREFGVRKVRLAWDPDAARTSAKKLAYGARNLRGEIERAALRLQTEFAVEVVDMSDPPAELGVSKLDPGELLRHPEAAPWFRERLANAMDVRSQAFFEWRLS